MLQKLSIKNIALIESAEISFSHGLNVLSGETGAGKSVILESLNFVLGAKADKSLIRNGESECTVTAEFDVSASSSTKKVFSDFDIEVDDYLIITRKFNLDGKSSIKINGNSATVGMLKKFTSNLVDVHGQSEHFYLLSESNQLDLIDKLGYEDNSLIKEKLQIEYSEYKKIISSLNALGGDESQRLVRLDILNYQIKEISDANIKEGEEEELLIIRQKLQYQEKIVTALNSIKSAINDEGGISDILSNTNKLSSSICAFGDDFVVLDDRICSASAEIDDICNLVQNLLDGFDIDEYDADYVEDRLDLIKKIKRKYGNDFNEIREFLQKAIVEKENLENFNEVARDLLVKKEEKETVLYDLYNELSSLRKQTSKEFAVRVVEEFKELGMQNGQFFVSYNEFPDIANCKFESDNGVDEVSFMFSANLGENVKPLSFVISGGEMSRFMLAIKAQTARCNEISTFIFDEIDSGISGVIAKVVAEKFAKIALDTQIIAVSHLPQISAMANTNLLISKHENAGRTITKVKTLTEKEKIDEIIRLVGGEIQSASAKEHAIDLVDKAIKYKKSIKKSN